MDIGPQLKFEVHDMRERVIHALSVLQEKMDAEITQAVREYCTPENLAAIIQKTADKEIEAAIRGAVEDFFRYGPGRHVIKEAVETTLKRRYRLEDK